MGVFVSFQGSAHLITQRPLRKAVADAKQRPGKQSAKPTQLAPVPRHEAKGFVAFGLDLRNPEG